MQPQLQKLWEHQQKFHDITDEATLALLEEGEQQGIVGDQFKSTWDQILTVLLGIAKVLGADIPNYLDKIDGKKATINVHTNYTSSGTPPPPGPPTPPSPSPGEGPDHSFAVGFGAGGPGGWKSGPSDPLRGNLLAMLHEGERLWVIPKGQHVQGFVSAARGFGKGDDDLIERRPFEPFLEMNSENGNFFGGSGAFAGTFGGAVASALEGIADQVSEAVAAAIQAQGPAKQFQITNAPQINVQKLVSSDASQANQTVGQVARALRLNSDGLASRVREIALAAAKDVVAGRA
jgi:hypothetical protein